MTQAPPPSHSGQMRSHRGIMILIFGILGIVFCIIFGILAWAMGSKDIKEMDAGRMDPSGRGMTQVGRILGMVSVVLWIIAIIFYVIVGVGAAVTP